VRKMARIGKCKECKKGWVVLGTYANIQQSCDAVGFCKECFTEHRLKFAHSRSRNYVIMKDWKLKEWCVIESCDNERFEECCYGMCAKHCQEKKYHYLEEGEIETKYPNIFRKCKQSY